MQAHKKTLLQLILTEHSKAQRDHIVDWVGDDFDRFRVLMDLFCSSDKKIVQRASWPIRVIADRHLDWFIPFIPQLVQAVRHPLHDAVSRNGLLILGALDVQDEDQMGYLADICFGLLADVKSPTAIKRGALMNLANICQKEPDLAEEVILLTQEQIPHSTVGFKHYAKSTIKELTRLR